MSPRSFVALACASCGGAAAAPDAPADAAATCSATFSGSFTEASSGDGDCATLSASGADVVLGFAIPSTTIAAPLALAFDLGPAPSPGRYAPEIVQTWSAIATSSVDSACVYSAGQGAVPSGTFTLTLDAIDASAAHGSLEVDTFLHAFVMTTCGAVPTETVVIEF